VQSEKPEEKQYINVEVRCGGYDDDDVSELVEALNTNKQVDEFSLANHRHEFEWLRKTLPNPPFPKIAYFFGDDGEYNVQEALMILAAFAMTDEEGNPSSVNAYYGAQHCLDFYEGSNGAKGKEIPVEKIVALKPILGDLFELYERIPERLPDLYVKS